MSISSQLASSRLIQPGVIDNTAARPATPFEGQCIFQKDTDQLLVWNGTAWVMPNKPAQNPDGLEFIKSQTVGTAVSSVTVTDAFSATYDNYRVVISGVSISASGNSWFVKLNNSTGSTYKYAGDYMDFSSSTKFPLSSNGNANGMWAGVGAGSHSASMDITNPFLASPTSLYGQSSNSTYANEFRCHDTNPVSSSSFILVQTTITMTGGTIAVYGYRK